LRQAGHLALRDHTERIDLGGTFEQPAHRAHFPQQNAGAEQVDALVWFAALELLWCDIAELPLDHAGAGGGNLVDCLGNAKVSNLYKSVTRDQNVLRRDITMQNRQAFAAWPRQIVGVGQATQKLHGDMHGNFGRQHHFAASRLLEDGPDSHAGNIFHGDIIFLALLG
jgi:hypothetical protein